MGSGRRDPLSRSARQGDSHGTSRCPHLAHDAPAGSGLGIRRPSRPGYRWRARRPVTGLLDPVLDAQSLRCDLRRQLRDRVDWDRCPRSAG